MPGYAISTAREIDEILIGLQASPGWCTAPILLVNATFGLITGTGTDYCGTFGALRI